MAAVIARKLNLLPNLCKHIRLCCHVGTLGLGQCRRSTFTSPSIISRLCLPTLLPVRSSVYSLSVMKTFIYLNIIFHYFIQVFSFGLEIQRYLSTTSSNTATTIESAKPISKGDVKLDSEGPEKSGDSNRSKSDGGKPVRGGPVSWLSFLLLVLTGAGILWYYDREKKRHIEEISNASQAVKQGPSAGKAAIGGPFNLVNHDGKYVTDKDFLGNWTIIYFGFTHCPDICPDELLKLAAAVDKIKEKSAIDVVPVFISVDPERDTVEQVCEYVKEFHPKLVGLTGSPDEIKKVARAYRVYYMKTAEEDSDYLVDHSIVMYLMSPKMEFVKFFGKNHDVDSLVDGVVKEIKQHKK